MAVTVWPASPVRYGPGLDAPSCTVIASANSSHLNMTGYQFSEFRRRRVPRARNYGSLLVGCRGPCPGGGAIGVSYGVPAASAAVIWS